MKYWIYAILFFTFATEAKKHDPFDSHSQIEKADSIQPQRVSKGLNCHPEQHTVAENIPFSKLNLIGVLVEKGSREALFSDQQKQIFSVKQGELVSADKIKIQGIQKQNITLEQWKHSCDKAEIINLKL